MVPFAFMDCPDCVEEEKKKQEEKPQEGKKDAAPGGKR
jgi:hypothetical protein